MYKYYKYDPKTWLKQICSLCQKNRSLSKPYNFFLKIKQFWEEKKEISGIEIFFVRIELQNGELALGPQNLHRLQHALAPIFFPAAPRDSKTPEMNVSDRDLDDKKKEK